MQAERESPWILDPGVVFLNHGSFGACPRPILEAQAELRLQMEREPIQFLHRELEERADAARRALAAFLGADPEGLAFVTNATTGVNTVLHAWLHQERLEPGDELLVTDHEYNACRNALEVVARHARARVVVAPLPFPFQSDEQLVEALLSKVGRRTRLAMVDHVTSQTGIVLPIDRIVPALTDRGVEVLVDGAHAPGMIPVSLDVLNAAYYTGNCHKWLCAPKGAGFLWVREDLRKEIRPLAVSHGANSPRTDRPRFQLEFDWTGTHDPTPYLCVPEAIRFLGSLLPGGWPELMQRNRSLALEARALLCAALRTDPPCPADFLGALATIALPDGVPGSLHPKLLLDPLQIALFDRHRIEVPVIPWPEHPRRWLRVSAQLYNSRGQYERLAAVLPPLLREFGGPARSASR